MNDFILIVIFLAFVSFHRSFQNNMKLNDHKFLLNQPIACICGKSDPKSFEELEGFLDELIAENKETSKQTEWIPDTILEMNPVCVQISNDLKKFVAKQQNYPPIPTLTGQQIEYLRVTKLPAIAECNGYETTAKSVLQKLQPKIQPLQAICNGIIERMKPLLELPDNRCGPFADEWDRLKKKPIQAGVVNELITAADNFKAQYSQKTDEFKLELHETCERVNSISNSLDEYRKRVEDLNKLANARNSIEQLTVTGNFRSLNTALESALKMTDEIIAQRSNQDKESVQSTLILALINIRQQVLDAFPKILAKNKK